MTQSEITNNVLLQTDFPDLTLYASGKVRDIYKVDTEHLLFVATDRISAFDYVLATGIPQKGRVLTQLSLFWFDFLKDIVANHAVTADVSKYPPELQRYADQLRGRSMLVIRANMVNIECVVRGYLSGSGWKEYKSTGAVCGIKLPAGLRESDKLPEPIFTPVHEGRQRSRREHFVRRNGEDCRPRLEREAARPEPEGLHQLRAITPRPKASSSPTPSLSLARPRRDWSWLTKF